MRGDVLVRLGFILALALVIATAKTASAAPIEETAKTCAACHGAAGVPISAKIPVIWGQQAGYIYLDLKDFKSGARKNPLMSPMAAGLSKADMMALAEYFSKRPWPTLAQKRASDIATRTAEVDANSGQCTQCHLGGYLGGGTTPRLADQNRDYLVKTMLDFRSGARANNPWMTDLLKTYKDTDIQALADYLAGM
jgi:cytochrome c553